ncbi:PLP-dependent transferase [Fomitiporia mediterranea MF3/22]|uniref:PLP-dependent transferase n=1 Tax=Fomitiporia mediterranea (strain MF3/22) TaxID=694068 RepID=UPI0004409A82|nr:PLP-dependent transferase [Fomitiporia mediterranea MF3/22]EJD02718.1 PLP-dependent transferase [Fomitiporia mediterranea MF3/22]
MLVELRSRVMNSTVFETIKTALFVYVLLTHSLKAQRHLRARGFRQTIADFWSWICQRVILLALRFPAAKKKVDSQLGEAQLKIENSLVAKGPDVVRHLALPIEGRSPEWIMQEMDKMDSESKNADWKGGRLSGAVYHGGEDMEQVIVNAFRKYCVSNPLHPDAFPAVRKMEAEIVAMCLRMYNNPDGAGVTTSGGTESIIMAVKAHREWAHAVKGIIEPEMVIPITAHAAFDKAAAYLKIKLHTIPVDFKTRKVNVSRMRRAINSNTIMIVGSAVNFPDGNMDDIPALSALAKRYNIGLHVDCCLGSFIVPFLDRAGYPCGIFDFRLEGVTSISCDTHKYGFAPKGSSVVMYRNAEFRRYQYYITTGWPGGVYGSPSMAGSRPGSLIAGTWAAMQYMGQDGYLNSCKAIVGVAREIARAIREEIPELYVLGEPPASVVAFAARDPAALDILAVGDRMSEHGWHLNGLQKPAAVHIACTRLTVPVVKEFITQLKECVREELASPSRNKDKQGNMVAVYGLGNSSAVGPAMVEKLVTAFLDALYKA